MDENLTPDPADEEDTSQAPIAPSTPEFEAAQEADEIADETPTHLHVHDRKHGHAHDKSHDKAHDKVHDHDKTHSHGKTHNNDDVSDQTKERSEKVHSHEELHSEEVHDQDTPQSPEEIASIEEENKQRARNINKIFAAMMTTLIVIAVIFLAIYIPWRKNQNNRPDPTTPAVGKVLPTSSAPVK